MGDRSKWPGGTELGPVPDQTRFHRCEAEKLCRIFKRRRITVRSFSVKPGGVNVMPGRVPKRPAGGPVLSVGLERKKDVLRTAGPCLAYSLLSPLNHA
jgi:hypothetical protein